MNRELPANTKATFSAARRDGVFGRRLRRTIAGAGVLAVFGIASVTVAAADSAPLARLLAEPGQASNGTRTLEVSTATGVDPTGQIVTVTGRGFDETKGVYIAFCVDNGPGQAPTPCLGGMDMSGASGGSVWVSSNPPPYGEGLAKPYKTGGSFSVTLNLVALDEVNGIDCRTVQCAVTSRNDHTRSGDRSQDLAIPITFAKPGGTSVSASSGAGTSATITAQSITQPLESSAEPGGQVTMASEPSGVEPTTASPPVPTLATSTSESASGSESAGGSESSDAAGPSADVVAPSIENTAAKVNTASNTGWIVTLIVMAVLAAGAIIIARRRGGTR